MGVKNSDILETLQIEIHEASHSRISEINTTEISFGKIFSDHMFVADYRNEEWTEARIIPFGNFSMSPAASCLHYGQTIFEGLKAYKNDKSEIVILRPLENFKRFNQSAERMCMPSVPEKLFMDAVTFLLQLDKNWIIPNDEYSLYIRPMMFSTDEMIGVKPSQEYRLIIFTSPCGHYYKDPVKVLIETKYTRAAEGGVGFTKAAANYGVSLYPTRLGQEKGYQQLIWTDAKEHKYIEESGMMNVMFVINNTLTTPPINNGTILNGKTRDCILTIAKDLKIKTEERRITVTEIVESLEKKTVQEAFGAGTAATVAHIETIGYNGKDYHLPPITENNFSSKAAKTLNDIIKGRTKDLHNWIHKI